MLDNSTTNTLELLFNDAAGAARKITVKDPIENLTAEVAQAAMDKIVETDIFLDEGMDVYAVAEGARYVTRSIQDVYKAEA
ncbi:DUF2922 domain-containing protein [Fundicoccus sp. Sow4_F4]|uniref:DUF2922 domain-containing protein n=1 Tax=Fundicoccus sp. Sow4_F4 TaxID=3438783 RepID=UPI003F9164FB